MILFSQSPKFVKFMKTLSCENKRVDTVPVHWILGMFRTSNIQCFQILDQYSEGVRGGQKSQVWQSKADLYHSSQGHRDVQLAVETIPAPCCPSSAALYIGSIVSVMNFQGNQSLNKTRLSHPRHCA